jgi:hypothetical protein
VAVATIAVRSRRHAAPLVDQQWHGEKSDDHADDRRRHYRSSDSALLLKDGHRWVCWGGGSSHQG